MKCLYVIAGANGSGKSTVSRVLLPMEDLVYVNPDDIARQMRPDAIERVKIAAGKAALKQIEGLLNQGVSFAIESTLSGSVYAKVLERAATLGYEITIAYVYIDNPRVCESRIMVRVRKGGHDIPNADVERRYYRSKANFVNVYKSLCNHWMIYYNGGTDLLLIAHGNGDTVILDRARYEKFMEDICQPSLRK